MIQKTDKYNNSVYEDYNFVWKFVSSLDGSLLVFNASLDKDLSAPYVMFNFTPTSAGNISLFFGSLTQSVANSPLIFQVMAGPMSVPSCIASWRQSAVITAGTESVLDVTLKDIYNNTLSQATGGYSASFSFSISIVNSSNATQDLSSFNLSTNLSSFGVQTIRLYPKAANQFFLNVGLLNETVASSPFPFTIIAAPVFRANCWATIRGGTPQAGVKSIMDICIVDQYNNSVSSATGRNETVIFYLLVLRYPNMLAWNMTLEPQNFSGYQTVSFYPPATGNFLLQISSNKMNISGSPYPLTVKAGPLSIPMSQGEFSTGGRYFVQNGTIQFFIYAKDQYGNAILTNDVYLENFTGAVYNTDLTTLVLSDLTVSRASDTNLVISFSVRILGQFILQVGNDTDDIAGSPFIFYVTTDNVDTSRSIMKGDGLSNSINGNDTSIFIQLRDSSGNPAAANLADISVSFLIGNVSASVPVNITAVPQTVGVFKVTYTPTAIGSYQVFIKWKGTLIGTGSPIKKTVTPGAVVLTPAWCKVIGNSGGGVAGTIQSFQVSVVDNMNSSFPGIVGVNFSSSANPLLLTVTNVGIGLYSVVYNITKAALHNMSILVGTTTLKYQIPGSTFKILITPGPVSPPNCTGGFKNYNGPYASISVKVIFQIVQRDWFGNNVLSIQNNASANLYWGTNYRSNGSIYPTPDMYYRIYNLTPSDWYEMRFGVTPLGIYSLDVYVKLNPSIKIKGSPFAYTMVQEPPNATYTMFSGTGLDNSIIGQFCGISIRLYDQYNMSVVGNLQGTNSNLLVVTLARASPSFSQNLSTVEDTTKPGNYSANYTAGSPGTYTIRVSWIHPIFKTISLALFTVIVTPSALITEECQALYPGSVESISAYDEFDSFASRSFSYVIELHPDTTGSWSANGTLEASSNEGRAYLYSARLYVEKISTHQLNSRYFSVPGFNSSILLDKRFSTSSGFASSFLKFIAKWSNVWMSSTDDQGNPLLIGTRLTGFTIQGCRSLAIAGEKYLSSVEMDKYVVSIVYGGRPLQGSPFTIEVAKDHTMGTP